jgi:hypothetical protein
MSNSSATPLERGKKEMPEAVTGLGGDAVEEISGASKIAC